MMDPEIGLLGDCAISGRSEEHTSELQSRGHLVCRLLLEKKNKTDTRENSSDNISGKNNDGRTATAEHVSQPATLYLSEPLDVPLFSSFVFFFFNDTATTEIYTLSLHDALPIFRTVGRHVRWRTSVHRRRGR